MQTRQKREVNSMEKGYSVIETARLLGVKTRTVRYWLNKGRIKANKIAGTRRWIIMESEIERLQHGYKD